MKGSMKLRITVRGKLAMLAGILAVTGATAGAQISLQSAVGMALRSDPRMKMAQADVDKARASVSEAHDAFVPSVGASAGVGYSIGVPLGLPVIFSMSSQSLLYNFSQRDYVRAAHAGLQSAVLELQDAHDKVVEDVVMTYLNLDTAQRREAALTQEYEDANKLGTIMQERVDAGQDSRMELLQGRRTLHQVRLQQLQTQDDVAALEDHLARLMGMAGNHFTTVADSIPRMPSPNAMEVNSPPSFAVESAFAEAQSKQAKASGDLKYRFRPQASFVMNYSRISTDFTNYTDYYPAFKNNKSDNAFSIGMQIQLPIFDRAHQDRANQSVADAIHSRYVAEQARNEFLEGRIKLRHSNEELQAKMDLATDERDIAQAELDEVLVRLTAPTGGSDQVQTNPKDEENARIQESSREVDLIDATSQLRQAQVSLMRQTGMLTDWLREAVANSSAPSGVQVSH
jgi:outer membrane protein TolC